MADIQKYSEQTFESIKHINEYGQEFLYARELQTALEYTAWRNFTTAIEKAKTACETYGNSVDEHFVGVDKSSPMPNGGVRSVQDFMLSRYACYLIVMNGDPRKEVIAVGQTYFAVKTRQQEYGGLKAADIKARKGLKKSQNILDHMGSTELAANLFRATQTDEKLRRDNVQGKAAANQVHYQVGAKVRQTIKELGGTMPENLPTPEKSIKQLEREQEKKKLKE